MQQNSNVMGSVKPNPIVAALRKVGRTIADSLRMPDPAGDSLPITTACDLAERGRLSEMLPYRGLYEDGILLLEHADGLRLGFILRYHPWTRVGTDAESAIESMLSSVDRPGSTVQFGVLSTPYVKPILDHWLAARSGGNEMVQALARSRYDFMLAAAHDYSLLKGWQYHPRDYTHLITVTMPFKGNIDSEGDWTDFLDTVRKKRMAVKGMFQAMQLQASELDAPQTRRLLRLMLNPHLTGEELARDEALIGSEEQGVTALVSRQMRLSVLNDSTLRFEAGNDSGDSRRCRVSCITVDGFPPRSYLPVTAWLLNGHPTSPKEHISQPFYAYLNLYMQDPEAAGDRMAIKAAGISRQLISDSPSYRALMSHIVEQQDEVQLIRDALRNGQQLVASYMGVNIISRTADEATQAVSECTTFWKRHGFRASVERYVHFPVWLSSIPGLWSPRMDPVDNRGGLQRANSMTTFHAATLAPMQTEWGGTDASGGGLLLMSRRGQPICINVQDRRAGSNYNFVVLAKSGSGKSFLCQDLVMDFLARNGYCFIIDAGRSYYELCEQIGGTNLVFRIDDPIDLNPFAQIDTRERLDAMQEMLRELIRYMAFPQSAFGGIPDWQETILEHAIEAAWTAKRQQTVISDVADWLLQHDDERARDIGQQLRPYTQGRFANWFNGKGRKVDMRARMTVIEMDDLKGQGMFRNVVLSMIMQRIADTMYGLGDPNIPKLMMIDEAWDLLANLQAGDFIERAYRTYRKYGGSAGIITQGFNDLRRSKAAETAYANSSWLFALAQKPESLRAATEGETPLLMADEALKQLLQSVHTVPGDYSEVYVRCDSGGGVFRFITEPYTYWLFTTSPNDKGQRNEAANQVRQEHPDWNHARVLATACQRLSDKTAKSRYGVTPESILQRVARDASMKIVA